MNETKLDLTASSSEEISLSDAVESGNLDVVKLRLENGHDVNEAVKDGKPPLILATESNQIDIMKLLLEHGADITADKGGDAAKADG